MPFASAPLPSSPDAAGAGDSGPMLVGASPRFDFTSAAGFFAAGAGAGFDFDTLASLPGGGLTAAFGGGAGAGAGFGVGSLSGSSSSSAGISASVAERFGAAPVASGSPSPASTCSTSNFACDS